MFASSYCCVLSANCFTLHEKLHTLMSRAITMSDNAARILPLKQKPEADS